MRIVVLDGFAADQGSLAWDGLSRFGSVTVHPRTAPSEVVERGCDADALLTNKVVLDPGTIERLPRLRYVGILATGTNAVDLAACRARGIAVANVPGYSTHSVAQLVFALLLQLTHDVARHDRSVKQGQWARSPDFMYCLQPLTELAGKTLAVLGMGSIGSAVAGIARACGMSVLAASVPGSSSTERVPLRDALARSDFVSLHCPLTPATRQLVASEFLSWMKRGAVLVNTSRGGLVDERAVLVALEQGHLGGVALDVLDREPPDLEHPLLDPAAAWAHKVVVTPHLGWATVEARTRLIERSVENLAAFLRGDRDNRVEG